MRPLRLFQDRYTSRSRVLLFLMGADCLTAISAILFASGACYRDGDPFDVLAIALWATIPRAAAQVLGWLGQPRDFLRSILFSTLLVVSVVLLILAGWQLVWESAPRYLRPRPETGIAILFAWLSGFLLCHPRSYRLHDFFLGAVLLLGLLDNMPQPLLWLPLFALGILFSAAARHLLLDVFPDSPQAQVNLHDARATALAAAILGTACFAAVFLALAPLLERRPRPPFSAGERPWEWAWGERPADSWPGMNPGSAGGSGGAGPGAAEAGGGEGRSIGYSHSLALADLERPRYDHRVVLAARPLDAGGEPLAVERLTERWPAGGLLWKGIAFSRFDAPRAAWVEEGSWRSGEWPPSGGLRRRLPAAAARFEPLRLEVEVVLPAFRNLVAPYFSGRIEKPAGAPPGGGYAANPFGDIFPRPPLKRGDRYAVEVRPWPATIRQLPRARAAAAHPDRRYLEVPPAGEVDVDLRAQAAAIFGAEPSLAGKLRRLERFYAGGFQYSDQAFWRGGARRLRAFLEQKVGDCVYFATSAALLLRAGGVSTRLAVGFQGGAIDPAGEKLLVRNSSAHSWIEVYAGSDEWFPVDPTAWVPPAPDFTPPAPEEQLGDAVEGVEREEEIDLARAAGPAGGAAGLEPPRLRDLGAERRASFGSGAHLPDAGPSGAEEGEAAWVTFNERREERRAAFEDDRARDAAREMRSTLARLFLVLIGGAAALLVAITFFRPRRRPAKGEEEEEAEEPAAMADGDAGAAPRFVPGTPREVILHHYHLLQLALERNRNHRLPHQTPLEHGAAFQGVDPELDESFLGLHRLVYGALYGDLEPSPAQIDSAAMSCRRIRRLLG
jgi:transglutaminase-like putative cysteine protease